jgi:hypothetical protein
MAEVPLSIVPDDTAITFDGRLLDLQDESPDRVRITADKSSTLVICASRQ